ncbi:MAG TPA: patatin-like phospholipase family protein [Phycisphaerae bacterium]|nr:patatin-like phospholipase family protein [Phycisphaerae bacterium]
MIPFPFDLEVVRANEPVYPNRPQEKRAAPEPGIGLCLSGGGYRAMLFHLGSLWRLNEAGLLPKLARISSVSGGSITSGMLGLAWSKLAFDPEGVARRFEEEVVTPIRDLAERTIDAAAIVGGVLLPGNISDKIANAYRRHLYGAATLQDLPDAPRFVINATNVQSGALWRFSKPYMADYRVGMVPNPTVPLATAVAASSAFPPVLSPVELELRSPDFAPNSGLDLQQEPYTSTVVLTDGGVYDNLGLETVWKRYQTVMVSDAGGALDAEPDPKRDWGRHAMRVLFVIDNQVRSLRKRQVIEAFQRKTDGHNGAYWGIRSHIADYGLPDALDCPPDRVRALAATPTRLKRLDSYLQRRLINWGYAICDAALRKHVNPELGPPQRFPYSGDGI